MFNITKSEIRKRSSLVRAGHRLASPACSAVCVQKGTLPVLFCHLHTFIFHIKQVLRGNFLFPFTYASKIIEYQRKKNPQMFFDVSVKLLSLYSRKLIFLCLVLVYLVQARGEAGTKGQTAPFWCPGVFRGRDVSSQLFGRRFPFWPLPDSARSTAASLSLCPWRPSPALLLQGMELCRRKLRRGVFALRGQSAGFSATLPLRKQGLANAFL